MSFGNSYNGGRTGMATRVLLNVYDLSPSNDYLFPIGMGLHHTGLEISGREYSYGSQGGIYEGPPKEAGGARFRCQIDMGTYDGGSKELNRALDELRHRGGFAGNGYNLIRRNCNHFCNALCWQLLRKPIPAYINRLATVGNCCSCLLPKEMLEDSPVGGSGGNNQAIGQAPGRGFMNRSGDMDSGRANAFSGKGYSLSGGSSASVAPTDLTDRRERAR
eukprot:CAMPEP_0116144462 /NCGR_PEP_ID=MMETSP0329-20121206/16018_1 /TAXON_ID=697910 /ORGANISM="Pseudo-nitzschia arenysensis, Strain B593" /LENGTH=218 /DNA_ID=CAMNT_0003639893 /DNA_START=73 /DNA_END=725 /DNA_ORIENTATION=-